MIQNLLKDGIRHTIVIRQAGLLSWYQYSASLTLMLLVANLANIKWCRKPGKWLKHWQMGTHLRVLSEIFPMNTNKIGFRWFQKHLHPCALEESSLSIGRAKFWLLAQKCKSEYTHKNILLSTSIVWQSLYTYRMWATLYINPLIPTAAKSGLSILEVSYLQMHFLEHIWGRNVDRMPYNNCPWNILWAFALFQNHFQKYKSSRR